MKRVADYIKSHLDSHSWLQADLAFVLQVHTSTVSGWATGRRVPNVQSCVNLSAAFGESPDALLAARAMDLLDLESPCDLEGVRRRREAFESFGAVRKPCTCGLVSSIPCVECGGPVVEFSIPNRIWNQVVRRDGREHDREYLCIGCFVERLSEFLGDEAGP